MDEDKLLVGFTGDVMIGRSVNKSISQIGYRYPWGDLLPLLTGTDINIINLETTLTTSCQQVWKTFNFKASPDKRTRAQGANYKWCIARMQYLCASFKTRVNEQGKVFLPPVTQPER